MNHLWALTTPYWRVVEMSNWYKITLVYGSDGTFFHREYVEWNAEIFTQMYNSTGVWNIQSIIE